MKLSRIFGHCRAILAGVVVGTCLLTILGFFIVGRGGAISEPNHQRALRLLITIYSPLMALVLAFYFSNTEIEGNADSTPRFALALVIVAAWCLAPITLFATVQVVERVIGYIEDLRAWGETVTLAVLGFYFGKEKPANPKA